MPLYVVLFSNLMRLCFQLFNVGDRARGGGGGVIGSACIIGLGSVAAPLEDVWSDIHSPAPIHT